MLTPWKGSGAKVSILWRDLEFEIEKAAKTHQCNAAAGRRVEECHLIKTGLTYQSKCWVGLWACKWAPIALEIAVNQFHCEN